MDLAATWILVKIAPGAGRRSHATAAGVAHVRQGRSVSAGMLPDTGLSSDLRSTFGRPSSAA